MSDLIQLQPMTFPLHGVRLIEASAGTGKTYTITALYLRLLLGHGEAGRVTPLGPDQILVVTFTEAATEELRDRIRARITEARQAFMRALNNVSCDDPLLAELLASIRDYDEREKAVTLLEQAAQQMGLAGAGIALHQETGSQQFLEIERGGRDATAHAHVDCYLQKNLQMGDAPQGRHRGQRWRVVSTQGRRFGQDAPIKPQFCAQAALARKRGGCLTQRQSTVAPSADRQRRLIKA